MKKEDIEGVMREFWVIKKKIEMLEEIVREILKEKNNEKKSV